MLVTRRSPPPGQIVFRTLNQATCDVYSSKSVETLIQGNVTDIGSFNVCKIYIFWIYRSVGFEENLNKLRIDGMR